MRNSEIRGQRVDRNSEAVMYVGRYMVKGAAVMLATVLSVGVAAAAPLVSDFKMATLPQVKAMLGKDSGKVSGHTVIYSGKTVHVVAASVLPGFPFPSFEIHHVKNATLEIPAHATVDVTFINTNKGFGHSLEITKKGPPYGVMPQIQPVMAGTAFSPVPKGGKFGYVSFTWHPTAGTYYYVCTIPGHAATDMYGKIIVK